MTKVCLSGISCSQMRLFVKRWFCFSSQRHCSLLLRPLCDPIWGHCHPPELLVLFIHQPGWLMRYKTETLQRSDPHSAHALHPSKWACRRRWRKNRWTQWDKWNKSTYLYIKLDTDSEWASFNQLLILVLSASTCFCSTLALFVLGISLIAQFAWRLC